MNGSMSVPIATPVGMTMAMSMAAVPTARAAARITAAVERERFDTRAFEENHADDCGDRADHAQSKHRIAHAIHSHEPLAQREGNPT